MSQSLARLAAALLSWRGSKLQRWVFNQRPLAPTRTPG